MAAEYPAKTNYLYITYNASAHDVTFPGGYTMVIGRMNLNFILIIIAAVIFREVKLKRIT